MPKTKTIGERLIEVRGERSQSEWSRQLGINQQNISNWESNLFQPSIDSLSIISAFDGVNLNWLIHGQGPKNFE